MRKVLSNRGVAHLLLRELFGLVRSVIARLSFKNLPSLGKSEYIQYQYLYIIIKSSTDAVEGSAV